MDHAEVEHMLGRKPRMTLQDIIDHPRLPEARKVYLDRFLQVYSGDPFHVRLLIETGRFLVYLVSVILEAAQEPDRRETWFTIGLLKQTMAMFGLASGRHIDALVARMRTVGYMEYRAAEQDRRLRILSPTDKLHAHDREWLAAHYAPLSMLYPQHDYSRVMQHDPNFQRVHRRTGLSFMPLAAQLYMSEPDINLFLNRAGGYMVIAALMQAAMHDDDDLRTSVSYADIGDRFGISRTHVRKLLVAAEQQNLVKLHARGGRRVEILPRLWASHDRGMANGMYIHDMVYLVATKTFVG